MARSGRNDPDDDRKKKAPARAPETTGAEQEMEAPAHEAPEPEHKRLQNQLGNQALAAMLGVGSAGAGTDVEVASIAPARGEQLEGPGYGGDDDPVDAGPPKEVDLHASWRPRRRGPPKKDDPIGKVEAEADDAVSDDGPRRWIEAVRGAPVHLPPPSDAVDPLVQPSGALVVDGLAAWVAAAPRWMGATNVDRVLGWAVRTGAPGFADPHGRAGVGGLHLQSAALWGVLHGALAGRPRPADAAFVAFCLEIAGRRTQAAAVAEGYSPEAGRVPSAVEAFTRVVPAATGHVRGVRLGDAEMHALAHTIADLCAFDEPSRQVPSLAGVKVAEEDDDPLGLDSVLGAAPDPDAGAYQGARLGADRMAASATGSLVRLAATAWAVADTCRLWSRGAPERSLLEGLAAADQEMREAVRLLVEIARAVAARSVNLRGIETGLKRAAKMIQDARGRAVLRTTEIAAAVLPVGPRLPAPGPVTGDTLLEALGDGRPADAQAALDRAPTGRDRDAAAALLAAARGAPDAPLRLDAALPATRGTPVEGLLLGALAHRRLASGALDAAEHAACSLDAVARRRRNGLAIADAAVLRAEVARARGDPTAADALHREAGATLYHLGADGPLLLLARYGPPDAEP